MGSSPKPPRSPLDFERPRLDDVLYKHNPKPHGFGMNPNDGLPTPVVTQTMNETEAADLTPERFVCMRAEGREQCRHYRRQLLPSADKDRTVCLRFCTAARDESGEFVDLGNTEVLACEFRDPRDAGSEKKLDDFDAEIIRRQNERREASKPFDPMKALENQE